jgi:mannose-6-phosphate isomerase-like protein (cupin superfamily)
VVIRGEGEVVLADRVERIGLRDVIYVAPGTFHQFHATGDEPLGFLCIVDRERDRPVLPTDSDLEKLGERDPVRRRIRT